MQLAVVTEAFGCARCESKARVICGVFRPEFPLSWKWTHSPAAQHMQVSLLNRCNMLKSACLGNTSERQMQAMESSAADAAVLYGSRTLPAANRVVRQQRTRSEAMAQSWFHCKLALQLARPPMVKNLLPAKTAGCCQVPLLYRYGLQSTPNCRLAMRTQQCRRACSWHGRQCITSAPPSFFPSCFASDAFSPCRATPAVQVSLWAHSMMQGGQLVGSMCNKSPRDICEDTA